MGPQPDRVRAEIEDYCGEGLIALPEAREAAERAGFGEDQAVQIARNALLEVLDDGRLAVFRGKSLDPDPPRADGEKGRALLVEDHGYFYGPGDEDRTFFTIDCP